MRSVVSLARLSKASGFVDLIFSSTLNAGLTSNSPYLLRTIILGFSLNQFTNLSTKTSRFSLILCLSKNLGKKLSSLAGKILDSPISLRLASKSSVSLIKRSRLLLRFFNLSYCGSVKKFFVIFCLLNLENKACCLSVKKMPLAFCSLNFTSNSYIFFEKKPSAFLAVRSSIMFSALIPC